MVVENGQALDDLVAQIRQCRICVDEPVSRPLTHDPRPVLRPSSTARILIAGQAPGARVHASGIPFTDPSGDRLRAWMGVDDATFYDTSRIAIVPMGFCFPGHDAKGGDLAPRVECAPAWRRKVLDRMPQVELVLAVGLYAQTWHLGSARGGSLTATVGDWRAHLARSAMTKILPLPHPSWRNSGWLKRNPWFETDLLPDLRALVTAAIGKTPEN